MKQCEDYNEINLYNTLVKKINEIIDELNKVDLQKLEMQRLLNTAYEIKNDLTKIYMDDKQLLDTIDNNLKDVKDSVKLIKLLNIENKTNRLVAELEGNHITLTGSQNGIMEIESIQGNTLVNISSLKYISSDGTIKGTESLLQPLVAGKTYSFILNTTSSANSVRSCIIIRFNDNPAKLQYIDALDNAYYSTTTGIHIITFTANDNYDSIGAWFQSVEDGKVICYEDIILLEGDYTNKPIPSYFEGMKSCFEDKLVTQDDKYACEVKVVGKNKFDKENAQEQTETGLIKVEPNTTYYIKVDNLMSNGAYVWLREYDYHGNITTSTLWNNKFTTKSNTVKVDFSSNVNLIDGFMLCLDESTEYEPYKESIKTILLNSPLLEGDTIEQQGTNLVHVHRYGKVVLDGSTDESYEQWGSSDNYCNFITKNFDSTGKLITDVFCDKLPERGNTPRGTNESVNLGDGSSAFEISIAKSKLATTDVVGFRTWLSANPLTVIYQLKTPTIEIIGENDNDIMECFEGSTIDYDTVIPVGKTKVIYTGKEEITTYALEDDIYIEDSGLELNSNDEEVF